MYLLTHTRHATLLDMQKTVQSARLGAMLVFFLIE